ncbi:hypothetical protein KEM52_001691 [Ascosphaera acerosa]|nr:hypothetical protein KEM52_001691 [Ascosphaera acerosa]
MEYLIRLAQAHETFRKPELEALARLHGIDLHFITYDEGSPFCIVRLQNEDCARTLVSRSILTKGIYELWGHGASFDELHADVQSRTRQRWQQYRSSSFRFSFDTFRGKHDSRQKTEIIQSFAYLGFEGPIKMHDAAEEFVVHEEYEKPATVGDAPVLKRVFFGRFVATGSREVPDRYDLKKRRYISTTSMDAELTLITANMALAAPGKLFFDPFVGTGSFCVAMAHFGAHAMGSDIDGRSFRGSGKVLKASTSASASAVPQTSSATPSPPSTTSSARPSIGLVSNLEQYGLQSRFMECFTSDLTNTPLVTRRPLLDGIICDPPYGIREGLKVLGYRDGGKREAVVVDGVPSHYLAGYVPPKKPYSFDAMIQDILDFAAVSLVRGGRLAFWMPTANEEDVELEIPAHPNLDLVSACVQVFNRWSRRLLTYERNTVDYVPLERVSTSPANASADELNPFRRHYFSPAHTTLGRGHGDV